MVNHIGRICAFIGILFFSLATAPSTQASSSWPAGCHVTAEGDYICSTPAAPPPAAAPPAAPGPARHNFCNMYARSTMTGQQLYNLMQQLPNELVKYQFWSSTVGMGAGMNDLATVMRNQRFGGDQNQLNQWINHNAYVGNGNFSPVTGCYSYISGTLGSGSGCLSTWSCPPGP